MKKLIFLVTLLFSISALAEFKEITQFNNQLMNDMTLEMETVLKGTKMGEVFSYRLKISALEMNTEIEKFLGTKYIDEIQSTEKATSRDSMMGLINLLNYNHQSAEDELSRLNHIGLSLDVFTYLYPETKLFELKSQGYGSFGEANGFAILDTENLEMFILLSGYAE